MGLKDVEDLLRQQGTDWRQANDKLLELVQNSTSATTEANVLNRELKDAVAKIKLNGAYSIVSQLAQIAFYVFITFAIVASLLTDRDIEILDLVKITQTHTGTTTPSN